MSLPRSISRSMPWSPLAVHTVAVHTAVVSAVAIACLWGTAIAESVAAPATSAPHTSVYHQVETDRETLPQHEVVQQDQQIIDAFLAHVEQSDEWTDDQRTEVRALVDQMRNDEFARAHTISSSLLLLYPEYETAMIEADDWADDADNRLAKWTRHENPFLAADASLYTARLLMNRERHEEALQLLQPLTDDLANYSLQAGQAPYFIAVAQAGMLKNQEAIESFIQFLDQNPNAPERLRVAAWRQMEMLRAIEENTLSDVSQRMDYSRRRLSLEKTDDVTQEQQDRIVAILNELIREEEKKECSSCASSENTEERGENPQEGQASNPGEGESNVGGDSSQQSDVVRRTYSSGPPSPWSQLRDRSRDAANSAIQERLPPRYRRVVEEYNRSVNEAGDPQNR